MNKTTYYINGNAVRELDEAAPVRRPQKSTRELEEIRRKKNRRTSARRNQERALSMNRAFVAFLTACVAASALVSVSLIQIRSNVTQQMKEVAALESQINDMKADNDARYKQITTSVDLNAIKDAAINRLGMKVMAGPEKKSRVVTPEEKKLTAYHEAGHAVAGFYCKHHPRVHEITIIPRGQAGGYTMYLPEKDRSYVTKGEMFEDIVSSLGGRVAEQLILEDISTGASNDLQQATNIARQMITKYGFSERLGPVVYGTSQEETFLGRDLGQGKGYSETTAAEIDGEMRDIIDEAYETCRRTLTEHIDQLHALAQALMEREKLNEQEFNTIMAGGTLPPREGDEPKPEQPAQTVQAAPAETAQQAETAESAETAEPAEQAETAEQMPETAAPETPDAQDPQN